MAKAMMMQAQASNELARRLASGSSGEPYSALAGGSEEGGMAAVSSKTPGARGAAVQEMYRQDFASHPGLYSQRVRANLRRARETAVALDDPCATP